MRNTRKVHTLTHTLDTTIMTVLLSNLSVILLLLLPSGISAGGKYDVATGCQGRSSGDTWNCHCKTGMDHMTDDTVVFNQCSKGKEKGAYHGEEVVDRALVTNMGMAVYSGKSPYICGGNKKKCKCTCFDMDAVEGTVDFQTSASTGNGAGLVTKCLGLCGPNCEQGDDGIRYASILIHDICQSYIRSTQSMPNFNDCSDEGYHAFGAAILSSFNNGFCPT